MILGAVLLVGTTTGAVAGSMVTGKQVKDGTLTSADIKNKSLQGKDLSGPTIASLSAVQGYERRRGDVSVDPAQEGSTTVSCPTGKRIIGGSAYFASTLESLAFQLSGDGRSARAYGVNHYDVPQHLYVDLVCATVGKMTALPN